MRRRNRASVLEQHVLPFSARGGRRRGAGRKANGPRAGVSHEFIKPLVVGAEPTVTLRYKRR